MDDVFMPVKEAAKILKIDIQSLRQGIKAGAYPFGLAYKAGKRQEKYTIKIIRREFMRFCGLEILNDKSN